MEEAVIRARIIVVNREGVQGEGRYCGVCGGVLLRVVSRMEVNVDWK